MFEQYSDALHNRFPGLMIEGDNYPPPPMKAFIAQALNFAKLAFIGLIVSGMNPFAYFNAQTPNIYNWAIENKVRSFVHYSLGLCFCSFDLSFCSFFG